MKASRAELMIKAINDPDPEFREWLRRRREREIALRVDQRRGAVLALAGFACGVVVALCTHRHVAQDGLWGGLAAAAFGWCWNGWHHRKAG